ncbi:606_t:CDS:2 [Diversispora eburnea]|uniref:606_t:CDS:1 n=1 Tax=Diversispora eburnea TaxID=1213867 RepID=A0A9N8W9L8_9GLOM|nr:606_t:CDS:2 [Diversispora eburnea]
MPAPRPAVRSKKESNHPYINSLGYNDRGGFNSKQGVPVTTSTQTRTNSMYASMATAFLKDNPSLQISQKLETNSLKTKKVQPNSIHRPTTPSSSKKNFVEKNKNLPKIKKVDSSSTIKQRSPAVSAARPITPHEVKPLKSSLKKKSFPSSSDTSSIGSSSSVSPVQKTTPTSTRRQVSPPPSISNHNASAHFRSHDASAHIRSHVHANSPDNILQDQIRKLKHQIEEQEEDLRYFRLEHDDNEDTIKALRSKNDKLLEQNKELEEENRLLRIHIEEIEERKSKKQGTFEILSAIKNNHQRVLGVQSVQSVQSDMTFRSTSTLSSIPLTRSSSTLSSDTGKSTISSISTQSDKEFDTFENKNFKSIALPHVISKVGESTRQSISSFPSTMASDNNLERLTRPTAPTPTRMDRTPFSVRQIESNYDDYKTLGYAKSAAASMDIMEYSDESDSDDSDDSEIMEYSQLGLPQGTLNPSSPINDDYYDEFLNHDYYDSDALSKPDLDAIIEEEDEDDEFELEPFQIQKLQKQKSIVYSSNFTKSVASVVRNVDSYNNGFSKDFPPSISASSSSIGLTQMNSSVASRSSARPLSPASSTRTATPNTSARVKSNSPSSSRSSTPVTFESSRCHSQVRQSRLNETSGSSNVLPPPPPQNYTKSYQHYLRLIFENSINEDPKKFYDIKKVIDEGSSAKVYTAHSLTNPSEECAIKIIPLDYSLEFIFNEIYVLRNFKHKNIVDFKESYLRWNGSSTRDVCIAMEKCVRGDITNRAGKITQREAGRIAGQLLEALNHLHSHGVIHRDLKLSNILSNSDNEIKLADFGIASLTPTSTTSMVGTIPYMAPDVVRVASDRPYDTKVDIWSLGVCILELLTGKAAWGNIRDDQIMDKLRKGELPHGMHRLRNKEDTRWETISFLEQCFAPNCETRWSAEKLLNV